MPTPSRWLIGGSIGVPGYERETSLSMFTVGAHWTQFDIGRPGGDFAVGTVPWALTNGLLAVGARGGVALPLALSQRVVLLPSAGVSLIGVVGSGGGLGATGLNAGIAAAFTGTGGTGMRTGVTWHRFRDGPGALWLVEIGIVRGPRRR